VITEQQLAGVAQRLTGVPGVVGVTLGGSRARRTHEPTSDVDLGLYYRPPLDVGVLRQLAQEFAGPLADVSSPGDWGPWVDGGGWLNIADTPVDWIYRNIDRVRASCTDALAGRFELHFQVGHPFGVPNVAYAAELAVGIILSDPSAQLSDLRETIGNYPPLLRNAMVERLWEATFLLAVLEVVAEAGHRLRRRLPFPGSSALRLRPARPRRSVAHQREGSCPISRPTTERADELRSSGQQHRRIPGDHRRRAGGGDHHRRAALGRCHQSLLSERPVTARRCPNLALATASGKTTPVYRDPLI